MKTPTFFVVSTHRSFDSASQCALSKGLSPSEAVFNCENGMNGYEIRIYDNWQEWQPNLYIQEGK